MDEFESALPAVPPWHPGVMHARKESEWMPSDTQENFQQLMQDATHQQYFTERKWHEPNAITYKINRYGFRSDEFEVGKRSVVSLGCSYTFGTGLPIDAIWPSLVAKELDLPAYNLAWGGTSADTCFMLARYWLPILRPKLVVMAAPPWSRVDIIRADRSPEMLTIMPNTTEGEFGKDMFVKHWFSNERNHELNNAKNKLAVQALCNNLGIQCLTYNVHEFFARSREEVEYARDYMHAGPKGHTMFAERILNDYQTRS
jgi:lysophospholipase L1-like esterase